MSEASPMAQQRMPVRDICVFYRSFDIAPTIQPKPGRPRCYEQMEKFVCKWFVSGRDINGDYTEIGPLSYDEALAFKRRRPTPKQSEDADD
jgi:hypothetical protein